MRWCVWPFGACGRPIAAAASEGFKTVATVPGRATVKTGSIRQTVHLPGPPELVYRTLMSTRGHEAFTGAPARISPRVGGTFTAWGDYIHGQNVVLVPGKRIVQLWQPAEDGWPEDHFSRVEFVLSAAPGGTTLRFSHTRVPMEHVRQLSSGWKESYWAPLTRYLRARPGRSAPRAVRHSRRAASGRTPGRR